MKAKLEMKITQSKKAYAFLKQLQIYHIYNKTTRIDSMISELSCLNHNIELLDDNVCHENRKYIIKQIMTSEDVPIKIYKANKKNWDKLFVSHINDNVIQTNNIEIKKQEFIGYIYMLTNKLNGKIYIGQTIYSVGKRWTQHIKVAKHGSKAAIHTAIRQNNYKNFGYKVIEKCNAYSREQLHKILDEKEQYWIFHHKSINPVLGYNIESGGGGYNNYIAMVHKGIIKGRPRNDEYYNNKDIIDKQEKLSSFSSFTGIVVVSKDNK